jgi:hypothetical protein
LCEDKCAAVGKGKFTNAYVDIRETNITKLVLNIPSAAAAVTTVSLGDEITILGKYAQSNA